MFKLDLEKAKEPKDHFANIPWIIEKEREFQKNIYFCFIDYVKAFVWIKRNWKIIKEMGKTEHLSCLLKNHHAGQETTVRARDGTTDWFHISKGVHQGCMFTYCLFNLNTEWKWSRSVMSNSWDFINCGTSGFPVCHPLLEFARTHIHWVGNAFKPPNPLAFPSLPAFNLS